MVELAARRGIVAYPDLRAAAGHLGAPVENVEPERVVLPVAEEDSALFAVRVLGSSMDGGREPLRDGDWAVMRLSRSAPAGAVEGRVVLAQVGGDRFQLKRLERDGDGWTLASDSPTGPSFPATAETVVVARLEKAVRPETLAPAEGAVLEEAELGARFGLGAEELVRPRTGRFGGHLFVFVDRKGQLPEPDRVRVAAAPRPGETAFVLAKVERARWRYLGVARQLAESSDWALPAVDYATWRQWGAGREVSRRLPEHAVEQARGIVEALLALPETDRWVVQPDGRRGRIVGRARQGGLRVDGGKGGFAERTVSLVDLAWVLVAREDAKASGGLVDEARVNRLRYLEGTPKGATRWVDTGWALACMGRVER